MSAEQLRHATADDVINEVERRLRNVGWSSYGEDRCRIALLHIEAYRDGKARAVSSDGMGSTVDARSER